MMRKLAVTVFALSLAALGCGSDSGTNTVDTGVAAEAGKTDTTPTPGADTSLADAPLGADALDTAKADSQAADIPVGIDQAQGLDTAQGIDAPNVIDVQGIDGPKVQLDSSVDSRRNDAGGIDTGSVDAGTAG